ncbi:unnamed protein product [Cylicostephanus goldi]|uniref:tRNA (guanine(26)-N(2))-dimethyltransferase n=1 Tax=Cylicostephanus goldi TaxID=71465 RepID=A0A3P7MLS6_CYLGO|nr:unnamed protein product [Cylicostephanus goldi]
MFSGADNRCIHCGHSVHHVGPIYIGPIHNRHFVEGILNSLKETSEEERLGTHNRLLGVLTNVAEELEVPLYYEHDQLFNVVKCSVPKAISVKSAILNAGYKVSGSHCNPRALKTNAPTQFLWDICRFAVRTVSHFFLSHKFEDVSLPNLSRKKTAAIVKSIHKLCLNRI